MLVTFADLCMTLGRVGFGMPMADESQYSVVIDLVDMNNKFCGKLAFDTNLPVIKLTLTKEHEKLMTALGQRFPLHWSIYENK